MANILYEHARNLVHAFRVDRPFSKKEVVEKGFEIWYAKPTTQVYLKSLSVFERDLACEKEYKALDGAVTSVVTRKKSYIFRGKKYKKIPLYFNFTNADDDNMYVWAKIVSADQLRSHLGVVDGNLENVQKAANERHKMVGDILPFLVSGTALGDLLMIPDDSEDGEDDSLNEFTEAA